MTVEDHPVHPKTAIKADKPYGCHSRREFLVGVDGYYAPQRKYKEDGTFEMGLEWIPFANSTKCRSFALWNTDARCAGCSTPKDVEYRDAMLALG